MPTWLANWFLPVVLQILTPVALELVRKGVAALQIKLPRSLSVILAGSLGEMVNQAQASLTGAQLPPGVPGLVAILLNEAKNDWLKGLEVPQTAM